jgi:hypothetical protein
MTTAEITAEADYRWLERAGIYAEGRELTEQERVLVNKEISAFEQTERLKTYTDTHHELTQDPAPVQ